MHIIVYYDISRTSLAARARMWCQAAERTQGDAAPANTRLSSTPF